MMRRQNAAFLYAISSLIFFAPFFFGSVHAWAFFGLTAILFFILSLKPEVLLESLETPLFFRQAMALVFIWIVLQSLFWAVDANAARTHGLQWLAFAIFFLIIQRFDMLEIRQLLNALLGTALFQVFYGLWQLHQSPERVLWQIKEAHLGYLTGTYMNRNHCAGLLELSLGVAAGLFCSEVLQKNKMKSGVYGLIVIILGMALVKTGSRFGAASFFLAAAMAGFSGFILSSRLRKPFFVLAFFFLAILITQGETLLNRFQLDSGYLTTVTGRLWAWQDASRMLNEYGLIGAGLGGFERGFAPYQSARLLMGWAHAHQDYLELAIELGLPMLILWLAAWLSFGFRVWSTLREHAEMTCVAGGIAVGMVSLGIHGFMDFNFAIPANAFLWIFLAGCLERLRRMAKNHGVESVCRS